MKSDIPAVISLLHQEPMPASAQRLFRSRPVLDWTVGRLKQAVEKVVILCWADQVSALASQENVLAIERAVVPSVDAISAARRWADGWRGGLLSSTCFDVGFHGPSVLAAINEMGADKALLVDPDSAFIDAGIVSSLLDHADANSDIEYAFTPTAPGQAAMVLRRSLVAKLAETGIYPGRLLNYHPDLPGRDPVALPQCAPVPTAIARATERFTLDSNRQVRLFERATESLNGQLPRTGAEELLRLMRQTPALDWPREVTVEINTARASRPIYSPLRYGAISRPDMSLEVAGKIFAELAAVDDVRVTLAGVGDPVLHPQFFQIIESAASSGIRAIHVETDLLALTAEQLRRLATAPIDILTIHMPAVSQRMYRQMMDVDQLPQLIDSLRMLLSFRGERATPIIVPTFTKCRENLGEMESWYDHWIRSLGCAVITGPSTCGGQIPDVSAADMRPPLQVACRRLSSRMTILSSGQVVACDNDVHGKYALGQIGVETIVEIWRKGFGSLRKEHSIGRYSLPLCQSCSDWHRP